MEEWKDIGGYEGLYQVSKYGRIISLPRKCGFSYTEKKFLKIRINKCGYRYVVLYKNNKPKNLLVHRLVAEAFIPNPNNLPCVNHKDEDKTNNRVENLEWCTQKYNVNYGTGLQRRIRSQSKPVIGINKKTGERIEFESSNEAQRQLGIGHSHISNCCRGTSNYKSAGGYYWKYKEEL